MKIRQIYIIGSIALVLGFCGIGWFAFHSKDMEPVTVYKIATPEQGTAQTIASEDVPVPLEERAEQAKGRALESLRILRGTQTDPFIEKMEKAMGSPAFQEYLKKQEATPGFNIVLWWDFMESQGLGSSRKQQERNFREFFPTGTYADYEPSMRKKIAELALEYPDKDTAALLGMFWADRPNSIWSRGYFNGYEGDYDWAENTRLNASSILAEFTVTEGSETAPPPTRPDFVPESNLTEVAEENSGTQQSLREVLPHLEDIEQLPENADALEAEIVKDLFADIPNFPSEADFQKVLREQFSPQRFNTAMQTLSRHGPEEGLRRLKESDPEIATHVERLIQPPKETD